MKISRVLNETYVAYGSCDVRLPVVCWGYLFGQRNHVSSINLIRAHAMFPLGSDPHGPGMPRSRVDVVVLQLLDGIIPTFNLTRMRMLAPALWVSQRIDGVM